MVRTKQKMRENTGYYAVIPIVPTKLAMKTVCVYESDPLSDSRQLANPSKKIRKTIRLTKKPKYLNRSPY